MDVIIAFGAFAALLAAWVLVERRSAPAPQPVPEETRYGFLRRLGTDNATS